MNRMLWLASVGLIAGSALSAQAPKLEKTLRGHSKTVSCVAWSPDGKTLASGSYDETIKLWDVASGKNTATLEMPHVDWELSWVASVAYSPDGKTLASGSSDNRIRLWDVASGKTTATLEVPHGDWEAFWVESVAYSPDGKNLASIVDGVIRLWDVGTGKNTACPQAHELNVSALAYSPDGKILASGSRYGTIKLWDIGGGRNTVNTLEGHADRDKVHTPYLPSVTSVAFSPDGKTLASGSVDKTIKLWDVASGENIATLKGHSGSVESVAFSPDGKTLASTSADKTITIMLWDVATLEGEKATERSSGHEKDSHN